MRLGQQWDKVVYGLDDDVHDQIEKLVEMYKTAQRQHMSGKLSDVDYQEFEHHVFQSRKRQAVMAMRLVVRGHLTNMKWLAENLHVVYYLGAMSDVVVRPTVRALLKDYLAGSADALHKMGRCSGGCDIARYGLPYPLMSDKGIIFRRIEDCEDARELDGILRMIQSDAIAMRKTAKPVEYGEGLMTIPEKVELVEGDGKKPVMMLFSRIVKTGQTTRANISDVMDIFREAGVIS